MRCGSVAARPGKSVGIFAGTVVIEMNKIVTCKGKDRKFGLFWLKTGPNQSLVLFFRFFRIVDEHQAFAGFTDVFHFQIVANGLIAPFARQCFLCGRLTGSHPFPHDVMTTGTLEKTEVGFGRKAAIHDTDDTAEFPTD